MLITSRHNIRAGQVIRLQQPFLKCPGGTRGVCVSYHDDISLASVAIVVLQPGSIHAFTFEALTSLQAEIVGFLPAFGDNDPFSCPHGFTLPADAHDTEYPVLADLWQTEVLVRRVSAPA